MKKKIEALVARLEALLENATPLPWRATCYAFSPITAKNGTDIFRAEDGHVYSEYSADSATVEVRSEDVEFIVAVCNALPALIAELKAKPHAP